MNTSRVSRPTTMYFACGKNRSPSAARWLLKKRRCRCASTLSSNGSTGPPKRASIHGDDLASAEPGADPVRTRKRRGCVASTWCRPCTRSSRRCRRRGARIASHRVLSRWWFRYSRIRSGTRPFTTPNMPPMLDQVEGKPVPDHNDGAADAECDDAGPAADHRRHLGRSECSCASSLLQGDRLGGERRLRRHLRVVHDGQPSTRALPARPVGQRGRPRT